MKNSTILKKTMIILLLLMISTLLMAQSGDAVSSKISAFYKTFVRPVLIAWVVLQGTIGGIMANNKVRKSEEESSEAMIGWFKMIVFPIIVLGVGEIGNALY